MNHRMRMLGGRLLPALAAGVAATLGSAAALAQDDQAVRVSGQAPWVLSQWYLADRLGYLDENDVDIEFTTFFPSGAPQVEAGLRGEWDVGFMGGPPAITGGTRWGMQTVGLLAQEAGTHEMFVRADAGIDPDDPADAIRGQDVLVTVGSTGHMMLEACLASWGLSAEDVNMVPLQPPALVAAFTQSEGVLAQAWPPYSFQLREQGFESICDTADLGVSVYPVVAAAPDFVEQSPELAARFIEAAFRANETLRDETDRVMPLLLEYLQEAGVEETEENIRLQLERFELLSLEEVHGLMESGEAQQALESMAAFFVKTGLFMETPEIDFLAPQIVADALEYRRSQGR